MYDSGPDQLLKAMLELTLDTPEVQAAAAKAKADRLAQDAAEIAARPRRTPITLESVIGSICSFISSRRPRSR